MKLAAIILTSLLALQLVESAPAHRQARSQPRRYYETSSWSSGSHVGAVRLAPLFVARPAHFYYVPSSAANRWPIRPVYGRFKPFAFVHHHAGARQPGSSGRPAPQYSASLNSTTAFTTNSSTSASLAADASQPVNVTSLADLGPTTPMTLLPSSSVRPNIEPPQLNAGFDALDVSSTTTTSPTSSLSALLVEASTAANLAEQSSPSNGLVVDLVSQPTTILTSTLAPVEPPVDLFAGSSPSSAEGSASSSVDINSVDPAQPDINPNPGNLHANIHFNSEFE